jgi:hypothetical protein
VGNGDAGDVLERFDVVDDAFVDEALSKVSDLSFLAERGDHAAALFFRREAAIDAKAGEPANVRGHRKINVKVVDSGLERLSWNARDDAGCGHEREQEEGKRWFHALV